MDTLKHKINRRERRRALIATMFLGLMLGLAPTAGAQDRGREGAGDSGRELQSNRMLLKAQDLLEGDEDDRGVKMLQTILEQYPDLDLRYKALLTLGKHFREKRDQSKAVRYLNQIKPLGKRDPKPTGELLQVYLEGLYQIGVASFEMQQYAAAFPVLRQITEDYPNTVWANQAYYYIGMCHFAQSRWQQAIEALSLVGTFIDTDSETIQYIEAGRRFYVKVADMDLPVLHRLGKTIKLRVAATSGDQAVVELMPLALNEGVFIASLPTEVAVPVDESKNPDKSPVLQVYGGDEIAVEYVDGNTPEGRKDVLRKINVTVVSSAQLRYTLGTYQEPASVAYLGQPVFIRLDDADLDVSDKQEAVSVRVATRYKATEDDFVDEAFDAETAAEEDEDEQQWIIRDEVEVTLEELGESPFRSGQFGGRVALHIAAGDDVDKTDDTLEAERGDEVVVFYTDERHVNGLTPRDLSRAITVVGEIDARPQASQNVLTDPILKAKKNIVESTAFLELARIFKSMGLLRGAQDKAVEGLERVDEILAEKDAIPDEQRQQAFKLRWELFLVQDKFGQAIATCTLFNKLYPESPFVDDALLGIAEVKFEQDDFAGARNVYEQILKLPNSQVKARAAYEIARTIQLEAVEEARAEAERSRGAVEGFDPKDVVSESAVRAFVACARNYPDSEYAGMALGEVIDYYTKTRDFIRADDMLQQVFQDYPDAEFLDQMLLKWTIVAYSMGNFQKAHEKCSDLLFRYPESAHAATAKKLLPQIQSRLNN